MTYNEYVIPDSLIVQLKFTKISLFLVFLVSRFNLFRRFSHSILIPRFNKTNFKSKFRVGLGPTRLRCWDLISKTIYMFKLFRKIKLNYFYTLVLQVEIFKSQSLKTVMINGPRPEFDLKKINFICRQQYWI